MEISERFCRLLRTPGSALKVWLCILSYPGISIQSNEIAFRCGISSHTAVRARTWLFVNGWLSLNDDLKGYSPVLDGFNDEERKKLEEFAELVQ